MIVKGRVSTRMQGSEVEFEFEIEDGLTEAEIDEIALEAMFDCIDWNYQTMPS